MVALTSLALFLLLFLVPSTSFAISVEKLAHSINRNPPVPHQKRHKQFALAMVSTRSTPSRGRSKSPAPSRSKSPAGRAKKVPRGGAAVDNTSNRPSSFGSGNPSSKSLRRLFPNYNWAGFPDLLTFIRCFAIPVLCVMFYIERSNLACCLLFSIASATDWLDGFLARRWQVTSSFGAFLDPVADKLMVSTALILLVGRYGAKCAVPAAVILAREIAVSALREWMSGMGKRGKVKVGMQGKVKTAAQMTAIIGLLLVPYPMTGMWGLKVEVSVFILSRPFFSAPASREPGTCAAMG